MSKKDYELQNGKQVWEILESNMKKGKDRNTVFNDFLELQLNAYLSYSYNFENNSLEDFKEKGRNNNFDGPYEERYMNIIKKYNKEEANNFGEAMGELIHETTLKKQDILGELFEARISYGENGQYFTPNDVTKMINEITIGDRLDTNEESKVCDPACGTGRFLIQAGLKNNKTLLYGVDIDRRCALMAVLNIFMLGFNGFITHGNSLSLEEYDSWVIWNNIGIMIIREYNGKDKLND